MLATRATVVTVCGGPPPDGASLTAWGRLCGGVTASQLHHARVSENADVLEAIGVHPVDLPCVDAEYRAHEDSRMISEICASLVDMGAEALIAPVGIGGHLDHLLARRVADQLELPTLWYADLPYALMYGWPSRMTPGTAVPVEHGWAQFITPVAAARGDVLELPDDLTLRRSRR
jgi:hypothetical protein